MNKDLKLFIALSPLITFVLGALSLSYFQTPDEKGYWPVALLALAMAIIFSEDRSLAAQKAVEGMSNTLVPIMISAWLLAGALGQFLREAEMIPMLAYWLIQMGATGGIFVALTFIITAIMATGTGTAVGTILLCVPIFFPLGASVDANPTLLLGSILAGCAFGDDFSPLSDTTIASSQTQGVGISESVKNRIPYIVPAALLACILFIAWGGAGKPQEISMPHEVGTPTIYAAMFCAPALVVYMCLRQSHILFALICGVLLASILGVATGAIPLERLISIDQENFSAESIIIDGMMRGVGISVFTLMLMGTVSIALNNRAVKELMEEWSISDSIDQRRAESYLVILTIGANCLLAHNTVTILSTSPIANRIRTLCGLARMRATQLIDISANTVMHILPYMITVIVAVALSKKDVQLYGVQELNPIFVGLANFHSLALIFILIAVIWSGALRNSGTTPVSETE